MSAELALFWIFALCTVAGAAVVIGARNPINSAMALVATFFFLAGIYVLLWAHTIAVLQVLVYAGAIMVLFLFVIMLLSLSDTGLSGGGVTVSRLFGAAASAAILVLLVMAIAGTGVTDPPMMLSQSTSFGTLKHIGEIIYTTYLLPFEAVSLLLLVAIVGAVVVAKSRI